MVNLILLGAALVCAACSATSAIAYEFGSTSDRIRSALHTYAVSWSPTSMFGQDGVPGASPLFFIMWTTVWLLCGFVFPMYAIVLGLADDYSMPSEDDVLNSASFLGAGLFLSGTWSFLFTLKTLNSPWAAAAVSALGAALMLTAVAIYRPFLREVWHISSFMGIPYEFSTGWICYAAALSIAMAVHNTDNGGLPEDLPVAAKEESTGLGQSFVPLTVAGGLAVFAFVFGTPVLPLPTAIGMLFTRTDDPWNWGAFAVALLACGLGSLTVVSGLRIL